MSAERTRTTRTCPGSTAVYCDARQSNGDPCREQTPGRGDSAATVRRTLRELGWSRREGRDYCPAHA